MRIIDANVLQNNTNQNLKVLWLLQLSYAVVILLANWFDVRLITIAGFTTDAGTLVFPLTFILSDLITEVYGYKRARQAIWAGFAFNCLFILYGQLIVHLPSPSYAAVTNAKFDSLMGFDLRIIVASTISYFCSEPLNSFIMATLKIKTRGRLIPIRFISSTLVASCFDSFIFGTLAFAGTMPFADLIKFNLTMWMIKVIIEVCGLPISLYATKKLKRYEEIDIYDTGTKFTIFSTDTYYTDQNNHYAS